MNSGGYFITQGLNAEEFAKRQAAQQQQLSAMLGMGALQQYATGQGVAARPSAPKPESPSREAILLLCP